MIKVLAVTAACLAAAVAIGFVLTMGTGKPIGTDLSVIGRGKPTLVLAYENYSPAGGEALNRLREIRSDYDSRLEFVVADMGTPAGHLFSERYQVFDGQAVFLKQDGQLLQVTRIPADKQELRGLLESNLAQVE